MPFHFEAKNALLLIFFLHGILFGILLLVKQQQEENQAAFWLGCFSFLAALYISPFMLGYAGWYGMDGYRDFLFYAPLQQLLLLPPVLYFYYKSLLDKAFVFTKRDSWHLLPAALYLIYSLIIWLADTWFLDKVYFYADGRDKDFDAWYQVSGFLLLIVYTTKSWQLYQRYRNTIQEELSYADSVRFVWAKRFLLALTALLLLRLLFFILNPEWAQFGRKFWYYFAFGILLYYITLSGYLNSIRSAVVLLPTTPLPVTETAEKSIPDLAHWKEKIEALMTEQEIYTAPTLTIQYLADALQTHGKKISQVINAGFGLNFNDYVNQHRVRSVQAKMAAGEHNLQTIMSLAYDAGFNSKSTFNRAFKTATGMSPKAYLEQNHPKKGVKS